MSEIPGSVSVIVSVMYMNLAPSNLDVIYHTDLALKSLWTDVIRLHHQFDECDRDAA